MRTIFGGGGSLVVGNALLPLLLTSELKFWLFRVLEFEAINLETWPKGNERVCGTVAFWLLFLELSI